MARFIKAGNPFDAWKLAVKNVMDNGLEVNDERGSKTKEVANLMVEIADPLLVKREHHFWYGEKLDRYVQQLQDPNEHGFIYTYGNRFRNHFRDGTEGTIDQFDFIIKRLKSNKHSRRAIMVTFDPGLDHFVDEIPCIIAIDFKIRNYQLNATAFWRSNDMYGAYYANIMGIAGVMKTIAGQLAMDVGTLTTHAASAHIYETNFHEAEDVAKRATKSYMK